MKKLFLAMACFAIGSLVYAEESVVSAPVKVEADKPADKPAEKIAPKFIIILPEQVDNVWYWTAYTTEQQHIVQSAVEKAFVDAELDVIDVSTLKLKAEGALDALMNTTTATDKAREAGATYLITGKATAVAGGSTVAYGVPVTRSVASISAKIVRVKDGKVLAIKSAEANDGGQSSAAAGQAALKKAAGDFADELVSAAKKIAAQ